MVIAAAEVVGALACGRIADRCGGSRFVLMVSGVVEVCSVSAVCIAALNTDIKQQHKRGDCGPEWYVAAALIGLSDAGLQSQAYTVTGSLFRGSKDKVEAFAVFGVLQH